MKNFTRLLTASTLILGLVGCGVNSYNPATLGSNNGKFVAKHRAGAKWTILVHMAAENNLYSAGLKDLTEMKAGNTSDDVNVIVLFDGTKDGDSAILKMGNGKQEMIDDAGAVLPANHEINSGDPNTLAKFAAWAAVKYPAEHTMLSVWNHGSGLFAANTNVFKGFAWDDKGSNMNTKDLNGLILPAFAKAAGQPLDILGFDACLMAHVEIGYQAKGMLNYLIASEETEPGDGWDYKAWLTAVSAKPAMSPVEVGTSLVETYAKSYTAGGSQSGSRTMDTTLSLVDVNALNDVLVPAVNKFASTSVASMAANKAALGTVRGKTTVFYNSDCADLGHFVKLAQADATLGADVKGAAKEVQDALGKTILANGISGSKYANATGLVMYFPRPTQYFNAKYDNANEIAYAKEGWGKFLKAYMAK